MVAILNGDQTIAFMLAALMGSLLGFLRYNWRPASIYMGDSGAMFIGLMLNALSMIGKYTEGHSVSLPDSGADSRHADFRYAVRHVHPVLARSAGLPRQPRSRHGDSAAALGLSVTQVVLHSYLGAAVLGGIGMLVMAVPQDLALGLSGLTVIGLAAAAVALTRVNVSNEWLP